MALLLILATNFKSSIPPVRVQDAQNDTTALFGINNRHCHIRSFVDNTVQLQAINEYVCDSVKNMDETKNIVRDNKMQVGTTGNGTCGPTNYGLDCNTAPKGSFPGMTTLDECVNKLKGKACRAHTFA